jgi:hypothetical protein
VRDLPGGDRGRLLAEDLEVVPALPAVVDVEGDEVPRGERSLQGLDEIPLSVMTTSTVRFFDGVGERYGGALRSAPPALAATAPAIAKQAKRMFARLVTIAS